MKTKHLILLTLALIVNIRAFADPVKINGIFYNLGQKVAEVASYNDKTFRGSVHIPQYVYFGNVEYKVTSIGENAFNNCSLTSVSIPNSVKTIGNGAFYGCSSLTHFGISKIYDLSDSLTSIGVGAFYGCSSLTSFNIPESVTSIGGGAFYDCSRLTTIIIPENVTTIGNYTFKGCSNLTSITIPNGVTTIGNQAFYGCCGLTSFTIPSCMTSIGSDIFYGCSSLTDVFCYSEEVPSTNSDAFNNFPIGSATLHVLTGSLEAYRTTAPWSRFGSIIGGIETIEIASALDLAYFASRVNAGDNMLSAVLTADIDFTAYSDVMIENRYYGEFDGGGHSIKLKLKRNGLFCYLSGYVHDLVTLGSITTSEQFAGGIASQTENCTIERCQSKVSITSKVNGDGTHGGIVGVSHEGTLIHNCLVSGSIKGSQTSCCGGISGWADGETYIYDCLVRGTFTVSGSGSDKLARNPYKVSSSNNYFQGTWNAANDCGDVTLLTLNQVKSGEACYRLNSFNIDDEMVWYQTLGEDTYPVPDNRHLPVVFVNGSYINEEIINFADNNVKDICVAKWDTNGDGELSTKEAAAVTDLGDVFKGNSSITSFDELQYFTGLTSIGNSAFYGCCWLASITIPNDVTTIGDHAFSGCKALTSVIIPNGVWSIGSQAFYDCICLSSVNIPNSVMSIHEETFYGCRNMTSVTIGSGVTSIGDQAFAGCSSLTSITIPNNVTSIGFMTFYWCISLTSVTIGSGVTTIGNYAFESCYSLKVIYCNAEETPDVLNSTFSGLNVSNVMLVVPDGSEDKYKAHPVWGQFWIETPTGIDEIKKGEQKVGSNAPVYNLSGQRLNEPQKGINIKGGKKIISK